MNDFQASIPFLVGWLVATGYLWVGVYQLVQRREPAFDQTQRDVTIDVIRRLDWVNVLGGPIIAGLVVEVVWWMMALAMGVPFPG